MSIKVDLSVNIAGLKLKNPLILAAGILGLRGEMLKRIAESGAGAVITKSIGIVPRAGFNPPNLIEPLPGVVINAMGLPNPGAKAFQREIKIAKEGGVPIIASCFGFDAEEFKKVALMMEEAGADMLELNISCPNIENKYLIGQDPQKIAEVVKAVKKVVSIPVMVKLTPNVTDITLSAKAAIESGADAISAINTIKALYIDVERGAPLLSNKIGGMSGAAIKPIAVRCVAEIAMLIRSLGKNIPVIGVGGVYTGRDAIEFIMVGASAVQIGTAIMHRGIEVFKSVAKEMEEFMIKKGYRSIEEIKGIALKEFQRYEL